MAVRGACCRGGAGMTDTLSSGWREHVPVERGHNHSVAGQAALKRTATYAVGSVAPRKPSNPDPHDALSSSLLRALPIVRRIDSQRGSPDTLAADLALLETMLVEAERMARACAQNNSAATAGIVQSTATGEPASDGIGDATATMSIGDRRRAARRSSPPRRMQDRQADARNGLPHTRALPVRVIVACDPAIAPLGLRAALAANANVEIVGEADDGCAVLQMLDTVACDVVLLDLAAANKTGLKILDELADRPNRPPTVVISTSDDAGHVDRALALGAVGYVLNSAPADEVIVALTHAAAGGAYIQPVLAKSVLQRHMQLSGAQASARVDLSRRQLELLRALALGLSNKEIAHLLDLAQGTVNDYMKQLYARLGVASRAAAVGVGIRRGLIA